MSADNVAMSAPASSSSRQQEQDEDQEEHFKGVLLIHGPRKKKPIPNRTKVRFRWHGNGPPVGAQQQAAASQAEANLAVDQRQLWTAAISSSSSPEPIQQQIWGPPWLRGSAPMLSFALVISSLTGLALLYLLISFSLDRLFRRGRRRRIGNRRARSRELQVTLVPKQRRKEEREQNGEKQQQEQHKEAAGLRQNQQSELAVPNGKQKPFPKRIYELQAEEGYYSGVASIRNSIDID